MTQAPIAKTGSMLDLKTCWHSELAHRATCCSSSDIPPRFRPLSSNSVRWTHSHTIAGPRGPAGYSAPGDRFGPDSEYAAPPEGFLDTQTGLRHRARTASAAETGPTRSKFKFKLTRNSESVHRDWQVNSAAGSSTVSGKSDGESLASMPPA